MATSADHVAAVRVQPSTIMVHSAKAVIAVRSAEGVSVAPLAVPRVAVVSVEVATRLEAATAAAHSAEAEVEAATAAAASVEVATEAEATLAADVVKTRTSAFIIRCTSRMVQPA